MVSNSTVGGEHKGVDYELVIRQSSDVCYNASSVFFCSLSEVTDCTADTNA